MLRGEELYGIDNKDFAYPPWALFFLLPFAILPVSIGRAILMLVSIAAFMYVAKKLGGGIPAITLLILSPPVIQGLLNGNIDWIAALGFAMPPQLGIFLVSIKPQLGLAVALYWLYDVWHRLGPREVLTVFGPFAAFVLLSFFIWGFWPAHFISVASSYVNNWYNDSLWPFSIPFGLLYFVKAIRNRNISYAIAASPLLSPFLVFHSWVGVMLATISSFRLTLILFTGFWILEIVKRVFPVFL